ncbi:MAG: transcription factor S [Halobacteriaceae archaeon]
MKFCSDCGSMMKARDEKWVCEDCGVIEERESDEKDFISTESQQSAEIIESSETAAFEGKPKTRDVTCPECDNGEAWYTIKQTASADEAPTRFFKCTECGTRWREYN